MYRVGRWENKGEACSGLLWDVLGIHGSKNEWGRHAIQFLRRNECFEAAQVAIRFVGTVDRTTKVDLIRIPKKGRVNSSFIRPATSLILNPTRVMHRVH